MCCWQVRCTTCAVHHAKCADRKQERMIKRNSGHFDSSMSTMHTRSKTAALSLGILFALMVVKAFRVTGTQGGKKFLRIRTASSKNQDLRDKDSSKLRNQLI